jgi:hypothetical protein
MKLRVPEGCRAASYAGQAIEIAEDGSVEIEDDARKVLISHGFIPWEESQETPNLASKTIEPISNEDIRARLSMAEALMPQDGHEDVGAGVTIPHIEIEDISVFSRRELFAFLKAKGVSVSLPVTNEVLRATARHALGG